VTRALRRRPLNQITDWLRFLWGHFSDRVLYPSGLFVCLIGPDGSGKTTISRGLEGELGELFSQVRYHHGHWGLLPELKTYAKGLTRLLGRGKVQRDPDSEASDDEPAPTFGLGRALMYVMYYSLEYFLGHWLILWAKGQDELVLFDRYFYDYAIQSSYDRVPRWLLRLIEATIPRPDVLIWLRNDPAVIHSRKQELTIPQIRRQATACEEIVGRHGKAGVAWTDGNPRSTLRSVSQRILACMALREQRERG
jgi:energy-coupling factor transporter ATP-binding protein EcfA2